MILTLANFIANNTLIWDRFPSTSGQKLQLPVILIGRNRTLVRCEYIHTWHSSQTT